MTSPRLESRLSANSPIVISVFRIIVGLLFMFHGSMILFDWPLAMPMQTPVGSWPGWWAGLIEFVTGLLVAVGLFTRPAAFLASGTMAVAYFWQHWLVSEGPQIFWPFDRQIGGNGGEPAIMFCFAFFLLVFIGPGSLAADTMMRRRRGGATGYVAPRRGGGGLLRRRGPVADREAAPVRRASFVDRFRRR